MRGGLGGGGGGGPDWFETALFDLSEPEARAAYARLQSVSAQASVFTDLPFADAACAAFGLAGRLALVAGAADVPAAGAVVFEKRRGPFRAAALPPYRRYVTPLLAAWPRGSEIHARASPLDALLEALARRYDQVAFRLPHSFPDARPFAWAGGRLELAYEYEAPLQEGETAEAAWSRHPRRTLRRAAAHYRIEEGASHVASAVSLAEASLSRKGAPALAAAPLARLASALVEVGQARALAAIPAGAVEPEAALVAPFDGRTAYYWIAGSRPGPAMTVLVGHLAAAMRAAGCARLNLGGANVASVAEFKRGFGAALVPLVEVRLARHPALRLLGRLRG